MSFVYSKPTGASKEEFYTELTGQLKALTEGEHHPMPNLANTAALLWDALDEINWAGFYLMIDGELVLGPFHGKPACIRIAVGNGVCGTAVLKKETQLVEDVHLFPGHIACDSASNSEIVVPIRYNGEIIGVLDIDSPIKARFDLEDQKGLEEFVNVLESTCDWDLVK